MTVNPHQERARELAHLFAPRAARRDKDHVYCWENVRALTDDGLMGMTLPTAYGGQGASFFDAVLAIEEMARACTLSARIVVEANMGAISTIMAYGTEAQILRTQLAGSLLGSKTPQTRDGHLGIAAVNDPHSHDGRI